MGGERHARCMDLSQSLASVQHVLAEHATRATERDAHASTHRAVRPGRETIVRAILFLGALVALVGLARWLPRTASFGGTLQIAIYIVLPALVLVACLGAQLLSHEARTRLLLVFIASTVTVWCAELAVAAVRGLEPSLEDYPECRDVRRQDVCLAVRHSGRQFDNRSPVEVIGDYRAAGNDSIWIRFSPVDVARLTDGSLVPLAGISDAQTVYCPRAGQYLLYRSDERGFRNPPGLISSQTARIVLAGDSFTAGHCVDDEQTVGTRLRTAGYPVVSLGRDGSGPLGVLATLREYLKPLAPDHVIWLFYEGNDLRDLDWEDRESLLPSYLDPAFSQNLITRQASVDSVLRSWIGLEIAGARADPPSAAARPIGPGAAAPPVADGESDPARPVDDQSSAGTLTSLADRIRLTTLRGLVSQIALVRGVRAVGFDTVLFDRTVSAIQEETARAGARLSVVYLPGWGRYGGRWANSDRDEVLRTFQGHGIPVIDLHPAFLDSGDPLSHFPYRLRGHYGAEGYALVAREIAAWLESQGVAAER